MCVSVPFACRGSVLLLRGRLMAAMMGGNAADARQSDAVICLRLHLVAVAVMVDAWLEGY